MTQKHLTTEKGQSLVELSLVFTLLLLLLGGIIDLGAMFYTSVALRDTVQEGVIYGATNPTNTTEIKNRIKASASYPIQASQITDGNITITCDGQPCGTVQYDTCQGHAITIWIRYNHHLMMPIIPMVVGRQDVPLTASVTGTILQSATTGCPLPGPSPTVTPAVYP